MTSNRPNFNVPILLLPLKNILLKIESLTLPQGYHLHRDAGPYQQKIGVDKDGKPIETGASESNIYKAAKELIEGVKIPGISEKELTNRLMSSPILAFSEPEEGEGINFRKAILKEDLNENETTISVEVPFPVNHKKVFEQDEAFQNENDISNAERITEFDPHWYLGDFLDFAVRVHNNAYGTSIPIPENPNSIVSIYNDRPSVLTDFLFKSYQNVAQIYDQILRFYPSLDQLGQLRRVDFIKVEKVNLDVVKLGAQL